MGSLLRHKVGHIKGTVRVFSSDTLRAKKMAIGNIPFTRTILKPLYDRYCGNYLIQKIPICFLKFKCATHFFALEFNHN